MLGLKEGTRVRFISHEISGPPVYEGPLGTVVKVFNGLGGKRSALVHWDNKPGPDTSPTVPANLRIVPSDTPREN